MAGAAGTQSESGRYRYVRDLAEGGMGRVELAIREEGRFRRVYAVKRLRDQFLDDPSLRAMFLEEARIAGLLRHPNLVSVIDTGEDERGPFLVMDFVEGVPLSRLIVDAATTGQPVPTQVCVSLARQVAEGLHAAHELADLDGKPLHLVHRDVSPQNVIVGFDGVARLTDFGIAKALGRAHRTSTGILKGKAGYFSPEQLQFEEPDRRSDLFCLGIVLFELLASRRLYGGDDPMAAAKRILREPPPDVAEDRPDAHPMLVKLLFEMLAKDPEQRPKDAREVAQVLEQIETELLLDEDPIRPSDYVNTCFGDVREQQREEVRAITVSGATVSEEAATEPDSGSTAGVSAPLTAIARPRAAAERSDARGPSPEVRPPGGSSQPDRRWNRASAGGWAAAGLGVAALVAWIAWPSAAEPEVVIDVGAEPAMEVERDVASSAGEIERAAAGVSAAARAGANEEASAPNAASAAAASTPDVAPEPGATRESAAGVERRARGRRASDGTAAAGVSRTQRSEGDGDARADEGEIGSVAAPEAVGNEGASSDSAAGEGASAGGSPAERETPTRRNPELMGWPERNPPSR